MTGMSMNAMPARARSPTGRRA